MGISQCNCGLPWSECPDCNPREPGDRPTGFYRLLRDKTGALVGIVGRVKQPEVRMIQKHYVTFVSPGTFVPETTTEEIESWDVEKATEMARGTVERHSATPYSFYFTTRQNDGELDSIQTARSCNYFLGGEVLTLQQVKDRNDPKDKILIANMERNEITRVVQNDNSWRATLPLGREDIVLDFKPISQEQPEEEDEKAASDDLHD